MSDDFFSQLDNNVIEESLEDNITVQRRIPDFTFVLRIGNLTDVHYTTDAHNNILSIIDSTGNFISNKDSIQEFLINKKKFITYVMSVITNAFNSVNSDIDINVSIDDSEQIYIKFYGKLYTPEECEDIIKIFTVINNKNKIVISDLSMFMADNMNDMVSVSNRHHIVLMKNIFNNNIETVNSFDEHQPPFNEIVNIISRMISDPPENNYYQQSFNIHSLSKHLEYKHQFFNPDDISLYITQHSSLIRSVTNKLSGSSSIAAIRTKRSYDNFTSEKSEFIKYFQQHNDFTNLPEFINNCWFNIKQPVYTIGFTDGTVSFGSRFGSNFTEVGIKEIYTVNNWQSRYRKLSVEPYEGRTKWIYPEFDYDESFKSSELYDILIMLGSIVKKRYPKPMFNIEIYDDNTVSVVFYVGQLYMSYSDIIKHVTFGIEGNPEDVGYVLNHLFSTNVVLEWPQFDRSMYLANDRAAKY